MRVRIYTDGACSDNPGPGGWAAVFNTNDACITISGGEKETTNNRMELLAVVNSFRKIVKQSKIHDYELYSDSAYVVNGINKNWVDTWQMNGWKTSKGDDVKNKDLWIELLEYRKIIREKNINLQIVKVKGHSGNTFNELVDKLAKEEVQKVKSVEA